MTVKFHPLWSNFSSGEISPKLDARIDLDQYFNGCQTMENWLPIVQGGVVTRGGLHYVNPTKSNGVARLIPFAFSELQNYILEFSDGYIRFFKDKGQVMSGGNPYEIVSPYDVDDDLWLIRYRQDDEKLYLVHPLYPPQVLTKGTGDTFTIADMDFVDGPYEDEITSPTITPSATTGDITLTASSSLFQAGHVGAFWRIKHTTSWGYVIITAYTSDTVVSATVLSTLGDTAASDGHCEGIWSDVNGWPKTVGFNEGRILFGGNYEHPQTVWASKTGDYEDFTPGTDDDSAYAFTSADANIIRWITSGRTLSFGALNGEFTAVGPNDGPITATDPPTIKSRTTHGSTDLCDSVRINKAILFVQRAARKIREFVYNYADDDYGAPDVTVASEHIFDYDIVDMVYQQEPYSILWCLLNDGSLISCTYDRSIGTSKGGVIAWARHPIADGTVESIACIPYQEQDQLWAIVNRTGISGDPKRYVEYLDPAISVDSGLTWSGSLITTCAGLDHLVGKTVKIVGDGAVYPDQVIPVGGSITISPAATEIYIGLGYTPQIVTNRPEVSGGQSTQGLRRSWSKIIIRILDTAGLTVNGEVVPARSADFDMDGAPTPFSGDAEVTNLGWDTEGRITIVQALPLPASIVSIGGTLVIGDD